MRASGAVHGKSATCQMKTKSACYHRVTVANRTLMSQDLRCSTVGRCVCSMSQQLLAWTETIPNRSSRGLIIQLSRQGSISVASKPIVESKFSSCSMFQNQLSTRFAHLCTAAFAELSRLAAQFAMHLLFLAEISHKILSESREIPDKCRRSLNFPM